MNMSVNIAGVEWKNPVTVASGTFGSGEEFSQYVDLNKLGAVTTKGVANVPWAGNPTPRVAEVYGGMMNAIGLQNVGIERFLKEKMPFLRDCGAPVIVNVKLPAGISIVIRPAKRNVSTCASAWFDWVRRSCARWPSAPAQPATPRVASRRVARRATPRMET